MIKTKKVYPVLEFPTQEKWEQWLKKNHSSSEGIQLRMFKKATKVKSITYAEALQGALMYGWIDGQSNSYDEQSWIQKFTPRRARSMWSKRNVEFVEKLTKEGKMHVAGLKAVEAAKADGRWDRAYDSASSAAVPEDFLQALSKFKKAKAFFDSLNKANVYAITYRLQTAKKPETREKRFGLILEMMKKRQKFH